MLGQHRGGALRNEILSGDFSSLTCGLVPRRTIEDIADIDHVHLPPEAFMRSINAYHPAIPTEPGMRVDPVLAVANVHTAIVL